MQIGHFLRVANSWLQRSSERLFRATVQTPLSAAALLTRPRAHDADGIIGCLQSCSTVQYRCTAPVDSISLQ